MAIERAKMDRAREERDTEARRVDRVCEEQEKLKLELEHKKSAHDGEDGEPPSHGVKPSVPKMPFFDVRNSCKSAALAG